MLKTVIESFSKVFDYILPIRKDFDIVQNLTEKDILNLPKAENIENLPWVSALFKYKDRKVKAIIWELKYKNNTLVLDTIGKMIFDEILALISDKILFEADAKFILIPIPITTSKRQERGYNQSEYIARAVILNDTNHVLLYAPQWFTKVKETPPQSHSHSKEERIKNLTKSFFANENIANSYVILIDDVITTGSTLLEARDTLLSSGARDVFAFTIAH